MRAGASNEGISVHAIAGSYVVLLGLNCTESASRRLLGFAIERHDHVEDERYFLRGFKVFAHVHYDVMPGQSVSSLEHPFQTFLWSDFTAKPGYRYTYRVIAMYGKPKHLKPEREVEVVITTEPVDQGIHAIHFNRGVAGSQAYASRFGDLEPDKNDPYAEYWTWLSRGLEEAMLAFISKAKSSRYALRAAVYEFNYPYALGEFRGAVEAGADVKIIYDRRGKRHADSGKKRVWQATEPAVRDAGLVDNMIRRQTNAAISHNKFIVLLDNGKAVEVWTGSTNYSWGGIFGQSNVGHRVRDESVAQAYLEYWERLSEDPEYSVIRAGNEDATPQPAKKPPKGVTPVFFPRKNLSMMDWYVGQIGRAKDSFFITAAFGLHKGIAATLGQHADHLRYVLLESRTRGAEVKTTDYDVKIAVGSYLGGATTAEQPLVRWVEESMTGLNAHVRYAHTKFMIVDAMTDDPLVVSGSANFSDASVKNNDENMLIIRGDTHVTDVYLGEFMRLFNHHYFRYLARTLGWDLRGGGEVAALAEDDRWTKRYFTAGTPGYKQRRLFRWRSSNF